MDKSSTSGDLINIEWDEDDLMPLATLKRLRKVVKWSSDDEIPLAELQEKRRKKNANRDNQTPHTSTKRKNTNEETSVKRTRADWSSDDELPLVELREKRKHDQVEQESAKSVKRTRVDWSSEDDIPLAILREKRKLQPTEANEPVAKRLRTRKNTPSVADNVKTSVNEKHHYAQGSKKRKAQLEEIESSEPPEKLPRTQETPSGSDLDAKLRKIYYDPKNPASFSSVKKLAEAAGVSTLAAEQWLKGEDTYTLHRQARRKFKRRRYIVNGIGHLFQCDLIDMHSTAADNNGNRFILTCIDCFTRRLWAVPVKGKTANSIIPALRTIFSDLKPQQLSSDSGTEFTSRAVQDFLKENRVKFYTTVDQMKSAFVERANRSLRDRMTRFFSSRGKQRYIEALPDIVRSYNLSTHSATGRAPLDIKSKDVEAVWHHLYSGSGRYPALRYAEAYKDIKTSDRVRLARIRGPFEKKSVAYNWTPEVFTVSKVSKGDPIMYTVEDDKGRNLKGKLYKDELQVINKSKDGEYLIDKIQETRGRGASRELLVSWVGYGREFDSWIKESELRNL
jgi:transposase InsO family protein